LFVAEREIAASIVSDGKSILLYFRSKSSILLHASMMEVIRRRIWPWHVLRAIYTKPATSPELTRNPGSLQDYSIREPMLGKSILRGSACGSLAKHQSVGLRFAYLT
jgi:hypothetical protein